MNVKIKPLFNGLHWYFESECGNTLSIICHDGSYGRSLGLFESMASWHDDVVGYLTFYDVAKLILILKLKEVKYKVWKFLK